LKLYSPIREHAGTLHDIAVCRVATDMPLTVEYVGEPGNVLGQSSPGPDLGGLLQINVFNSVPEVPQDPTQVLV